MTLCLVRILLTWLALDVGSGHVVHPPDFDLFHAVGAVEIMDGKMDSGCEDANHLLSAFDCTASFQVEQYTWLMKSLWIAQMDWFAGSSLATTLKGS